MDDDARSPPSHFFTLRLWPEEGEDEPVWRGRVQHTASGEVRYFQGWEALVETIRLILQEDETEAYPSKSRENQR